MPLLPRELWKMIFGLLPRQDLLRSIACVNREWHNLAWEVCRSFCCTASDVSTLHQQAIHFGLVSCVQKLEGIFVVLVVPTVIRRILSVGTAAHA